MNNIYRLSPHETCRGKTGYTLSHVAKRFAKGNYRRRKMGKHNTDDQKWKNLVCVF